MPETKRFDPLGWFISACFTILAGTVALAVAIRLIESIWIWLVLGITAVVTIGFAVLWVIVWQRRRPW